jgi:hypothetical protein
MHITPKMIEFCKEVGLCVVKDQFVFVMGGFEFFYDGFKNDYRILRSVKMLDVSSSSLCWVSKADMLVSRKSFGIGVLDNCIYAVSHVNILLILCYKYYMFYIILNTRLVDI